MVKPYQLVALALGAGVGGVLYGMKMDEVEEMIREWVKSGRRL